MENKIITSHQLFTFTGLSTLGGSILVISSTVAGIAKQDAWISSLLTTAFGLLLLWIYYFLSTRHQNLTIIGMSRKIFGKWVGGIVSFGYIVYFFTTCYGIPWYIGGFGSHVMHETPVQIILFLFVAALLIAVYYGIETIARASELFYVFVSVLFVISIILVIPNGKIEYLQPTLEYGIVPILKGAVILSGYTSFHVITLLMVYPTHVTDPKEGGKALVKGFLWANGVVFFTILISILVLGSVVVAKSSYPTILLAREIFIGTILTRMEYVISVMWTVSEFSIGILYFYACIRAISEFLGLSDHRIIIAPMGLIILILAWVVYPSSLEQANWATIGFTPHVMLFGLILPVIMSIVYLVKKHFFGIN